ncbi:lysine--tRNA ligase [Candidatus Bathyarchaeota archaeon]|nr:lysine--tRNA ligase [Candidatus Bathyarchaeota archaeon]
MNELIRSRVRRLKKLLDLGINPFEEVRFERNSTTAKIIRNFSKLKPGEETKSSRTIAGRIMSIRIHGGVSFVKLADHKGTIQLMFRKDFSPESFKFLGEYLDEGDIVGITGDVVRTKRGELSILVSKVKLLSKAFRPLPSEWYGLKNVETRYRQRYLDFVMNSQVREDVARISRMINGMREYMVAQEFIEVNTPVLQPIYGGAFAKPFKTHHNFLKQDMFLRVAPELYLKKLIVGGFDRVFEIGPCFRNESVDSRHNPEFIQLEAYQAFASYEDMMKLVESVVSAGVEAATGSTTTVYQGKKVDFKTPWKRITMEDSLKAAGIDLYGMSDKELLREAKKLDIEALRVGDAIEGIFSEKIEHTLIQPVFVTHFPSDISPLAKKFPGTPRMAQRFEAYAGGIEIANAYSELNNPIEQYERFREEVALRKKRVEEYMPMDKDYVRALEYGMPPTGGLGIGIARLASLVVDKSSIKEVIPFPTVAGTADVKNIAEEFKIKFK